MAASSPSAVLRYTAYHDRRFVRLSDGRIIPLILCGIPGRMENIHGWTRQRQEWIVLPLDEAKPALTAEEMEANISALILAQGQGRGGFWPDWEKKVLGPAAFKRFFERGIKEARTVEEYRKEFHYDEDGCGTPVLELATSYRKEGDASFEKKDAAWVLERTRDVEDALETIKDIKANTPEGFIATSRLQFSQNDALKAGDTSNVVLSLSAVGRGSNTFVRSIERSDASSALKSITYGRLHEAMMFSHKEASEITTSRLGSGLVMTPASIKETAAVICVVKNNTNEGMYVSSVRGKRIILVTRKTSAKIYRDMTSATRAARKIEKTISGAGVVASVTPLLYQ